MKNIESARRLREALEAKNMKPIELARASGVSRASVSQYYNGTYIPSRESAKKMADVLGVDPLWLMGYDLKQQYLLGILMKEAQEIISDKPYLMNLLEASKDLSKEDTEAVISIIERLTK